MFFNGYRRKKEDYNRRAAAAEIALAGAIDSTRKRADASNPGEGTSPSVTIPDYVEPLYGWRCFSVSTEGLLGSTFFNDYYNPFYVPRSPTPAVCYKNHLAPDPYCSCGYYSTTKKLSVMAGASDGYYAVGKVAIWGRVEEYSSGYRSEYCYPVALKIFKRSDKWRIKLTKQEHNSLEELGREVENLYGAHVVGKTDLVSVYGGNY